MRILLKNKFIYSNGFNELINNKPLQFFDIGARGRLDEPWRSIKQIKIFGFEPDEKECKRLNQEGKGVFFPVLLWSHKTKLKLNITSNPYCSSVYKPSINSLKEYNAIHLNPRKIIKSITWSADKLDSLVKKSRLDCDFLKIDTQGSEYEILEGSRMVLNKQVLGVVLESWTKEVYSGQKLSGQILEFMNKNGFELFDINTAASWKRNVKYSNLYSKGQIIGLDLLFFRTKLQFRGKDGFYKLIKFVALVDAFGFHDLAISKINENLENFSPIQKQQLKKIIFIISSNSSLFRYIGYKILSIISKAFFIKLDLYPSLHY